MPVGTTNKFSALMDDDDDEDDSDAEDESPAVEESPALEEEPVSVPEISKAEAKKKGKKGGKKQDDPVEDEPVMPPCNVSEDEPVQKVERRAQAPAEKKKKPAVLGSNKFAGLMDDSDSDDD